MDNLVIKKIDKSYFQEIRDLEHNFLVNNPSNYYTQDDDDFYMNSIFDNDGMIFGVFDGKTLVGISASFKLSSYEYADYFKDLYWDKLVKLKPEETVFFNNTLIHKNYRGKGLQAKLRKETIKSYNKKGFFTFISTASPENIGSKKSLQKIGMKCLGEGKVPYSKSPKSLFHLYAY